MDSGLAAEPRLIGGATRHGVLPTSRTPLFSDRQPSTNPATRGLPTSARKPRRRTRASPATPRPKQIAPGHARAVCPGLRSFQRELEGKAVGQMSIRLILGGHCGARHQRNSRIVSADFAHAGNEKGNQACKWLVPFRNYGRDGVIRTLDP